jgi:2-hydroxy-3-oxopropionate reductase
MALRLLDAGHPLTVYDTNAEAVNALVARGAKSAASAEAVASAAEIVLMSLPTPPIVHALSVGDRGILRGSRMKTLIDR